MNKFYSFMNVMCVVVMASPFVIGFISLIAN